MELYITINLQECSDFNKFQSLFKMNLLGKKTNYNFDFICVCASVSTFYLKTCVV